MKLEGFLCFVEIIIIVASCPDCLIKNLVIDIQISLQDLAQFFMLEHIQI